MVTPYSLQSPEDIAKEYGGNKQKIMAAAQAGVVDPTAAVIAGMFIDRMRAAAQQEMAGAPTTVAQDTFAPPAPPAGGLGAMAPQGAPQMQPPMAAPAMPAPEGGIGQLDFAPAQMAAGGIVGYAEGDEIDPARLRSVLRAQESSGDYGVLNAEGSGAMGAYQFMPDTARALAERAGLEYRPDLMRGEKGRSEEGIAYQERLMDEQMKDILAFSGGDLERAAIYHFAGPNEAGYGPKTRQYGQDILRRYYGSKDTGEAPERDIYTAEGRAGSLADLLSVANQYYGALPSAQRERLMAEVEKELDPEAQKQRKEEDLYMRLAEFGFQLAASTAPSILSSISQAAAATLPGVKADAETRKEAKDAALAKLMAFENMDRETATDALNLAVELRKQDMSVEQAQRELALAQERQRMEAAQFERTFGLRQRELALAERAAGAPKPLAQSEVFKMSNDLLTNALSGGVADSRVQEVINKYGGEEAVSANPSPALRDIAALVRKDYAAATGADDPLGIR